MEQDIELKEQSKPNKGEIFAFSLSEWEEKKITAKKLKRELGIDGEALKAALITRKKTAAKALENSKAFLVNSITEAIELINNYAPEHLIIACANDEELAEKIINAGSIFLGNYSCESAGDYASGTNHALPTNGYAKAYSGVSVDSFVKKITFQKLTSQGIQNLGPTIEIMAAAEQLDAHKNAVSIRLKKLQNG